MPVDGGADAGTDAGADAAMPPMDGGADGGFDAGSFDAGTDAGFDAGPSFPSVGESYGGGIVYFVDSTGEHGLIAAPTDASASRMPWGCGRLTVGASSLSDGASNQAIILASSCTDARAAEACDAYAMGGETDWFLPSREELQAMEPHVTLLSIMELDFHWSSTELDRSQVASQDFVTPAARMNSKAANLRVRCIRTY